METLAFKTRSIYYSKLKFEVNQTLSFTYFSAKKMFDMQEQNPDKNTALNCDWLKQEHILDFLHWHLDFLI